MMHAGTNQVTTFVLVAAVCAACGLAAEDAPAKQLRLLSGTLDTRGIRSHHEFNAEAVDSSAGADHGRKLAQGDGERHFAALLQQPLHHLPSWLQGRVSAHLAPTGAIIYAEYSDLRRAAGTDQPLSWIAPLNASHKIDPGIRHLPAVAAARKGARPNSKTKTSLHVFLAPSPPGDEVVAELHEARVEEAAAAAVQDCGDPGSAGPHLRFAFPGARHGDHMAVVDLESPCASARALQVAERVAAVPAVWWVGRELGAAPTNYWANSLVTSFNATPAGPPATFSEYLREGVDGTGVVVGVSDSGIDWDMCFYRDEVRGTPIDSHDGEARKIVYYQTQPTTDDYDRPDGHGTHVVGTVAGSNLGDQCGGPRHNGVAPGAKIHFMDLEKEHPGTWEHEWHYPTSLIDDMWTPAYDVSGARIYSMSWACHIDKSEQEPYQLCNFYGKWCREADTFVDEHPDMLLLYAAGNKGGQTLYKSLLHPSVAKNVIGVGASSIPFAGWEEVHEYDSSKPDLPDHTYYSEHALAHFTGTGPAFDGRIKPDLTAPGHRLISARSDGNTSTDNCGLLPMSGTSMATPALAGASAVLRQYLQEGYWGDGTKDSARRLHPASSLMRSLLTAAAMVNATTERENGLWLDSHSFDIDHQTIAPIPVTMQPRDEHSGTHTAGGHEYNNEPIGDASHFAIGSGDDARYHYVATDPIRRFVAQLVCHTGQVDMYYHNDSSVSTAEYTGKSTAPLETAVSEVEVMDVPAGHEFYFLLHNSGGDYAHYCFINTLAYDVWPPRVEIEAGCRDRPLSRRPPYYFVEPRVLYPAHYRITCPLEECDYREVWDARGTAQYRDDSIVCIAARHAGLRRRGYPSAMYATMHGTELHWTDDLTQWYPITHFIPSAMNGIETGFYRYSYNAFELWMGIWHGYDGPDRVLDASHFRAAEPGAGAVWHPWWGFGFPTLRRAAPLPGWRRVYRPFLLALGEEPAVPAGAAAEAYVTLPSGFVAANTSAVGHGESRTFCLDLPADASGSKLAPRGVGAVSFSLVWTDPPASVGAAFAIVHDLDLTVRELDPLAAPGPVLPSYYGNHGRGPDRINTIEKVRAEAPTGSQICADVYGQHIYTRPHQAFALTAVAERTGGGLLPEALQAGCGAGCHVTMRGNGVCEEACNTDACGFDNGDCSGGGSGDGDDDDDDDTDPWMVVAVTLISVLGAAAVGFTAVRVGQRCLRSRRASVVGEAVPRAGSRLPVRTQALGQRQPAERAARSSLLENAEEENARL